MPEDRRPKIVDLTRIKVSCEACAMHQICLPIGLDRADMERLDNIIQRRRPMRRGDELFRQGERFRSVYAVRSGSLKTYTLTPDGEERVIGFHLPGELVGLDAIGRGRYPGSARALETTSYCEIPFDLLEELAGTLPSLRRQLLRLMSKEIFCDETMLMMLGKTSAEARLATFLIGFSNRFRERGFSPVEFRLNMSRGDIASYLGLAVETVSRLFTRFHEQGLVAARGKQIRILDLDGLRALVSGGYDPAADRPSTA